MARIINFADGANSATTPTIGNIVASNLVQYADDATYEANETGAPATGNLYYNTTDNTIRYYDGTTWRQVARNVDVVANANDIADIRTTTGTADGDTDMGTYTGTLINDNESTKQNIQQVETAVESNTQEAADIRTTLGTANGATDMGTYTGVTISDNVDQRVVNQELETALEAIPAGLAFQGNWDADTNTPTLVSSTGTGGHYYNVSVAGSTNLDGETDWNVGDWAVFTDTGVWQRIDNSETVTSVNGQSGAVVLDADDISDAATTNKWNVTHTGEVTGGTTLTVDPTAITNKTEVTPVSGDFLLFSDTSDSGNLKKVDFIDLAGGEDELINFIANGEFEVDTSGWARYNDGAAVPVDGTGGVTTNTFNRITTSTLVINGIATGRLNGGGVGEGASYDFTIPQGYKNSTMYFSVRYITDQFTVADDFRFYIYDITNAVMTELSPDDVVFTTPDDATDGSGLFTATYETSDADDYRLIVHKAVAGGSKTIFLDDIWLGPYQLYPKKKKTQTKFLTADVTAPADAAVFTDLTFNGLTVGSWYRVHIQAFYVTTGADNVAVRIFNGGTQLGRTSESFSAAAGGSDDATLEFEAGATTVTFTALSFAAGSTLAGNSTKDETWAKLTEIDALEETSIFT